MILPSPWQRGQVETLTIWPSIVRRVDRISPRPPHWSQIDRLGAGLGTAAGTRLAAAEDRELDLLLDAADGLLEGDPEVVAEVGAGEGMTPPSPRLGATEERVEDVAEVAEPAAEAAVAARVAHGSEHVVRLAALGIGQDLVGLVDLLEPEVGARVLVDVRVPLLGEPPEGALDLGVRGVPPDAKDRVEVALLGGHSAEVYREVGGRCGGPSTIDR